MAGPDLAQRLGVAGVGQGRRGWELPRHLAVGDVLEFGLAADQPADGTAVAGCGLRWYGWLRYSHRARPRRRRPLRRTPAAAADAAAATVAELRLAQLPGLGIDPRLGTRRARRRRSSPNHDRRRATAELMAGEPASCSEPGAGFEVVLIAVAGVRASAPGCSPGSGARLVRRRRAADGTVDGGLGDWLTVAGRLLHRPATGRGVG